MLRYFNTHFQRLHDTNVTKRNVLMTVCATVRRLEVARPIRATGGWLLKAETGPGKVVSGACRAHVARVDARRSHSLADAHTKKLVGTNGYIECWAAALCPEPGARDARRAEYLLSLAVVAR